MPLQGPLQTPTQVVAAAAALGILDPLNQIDMHPSTLHGKWATVPGTAYYLSPSGSFANDGKDPSRPWPNLFKVVDDNYLRDVVVAGDSLNLMTGDHGEVTIRDKNPADYITIRSMDGQTPLIGMLAFERCSYFALELLRITGGHTGQEPPSGNGQGLIRLDERETTSHHFVIYGCQIYSWDKAQTWTKADWRQKVSNGINLKGTTDVLIERCLIYNIATACQMMGARNTFRSNWIKRFCGDAMNLGGVDNLVEKNIITDLYDIDDGYHHDGIQLIWGPKDHWFEYPILNPIIRSNVIIAQTVRGGERFHLQGIFSASNQIRNALVENNFIITDSYHGISTAVSSDPYVCFKDSRIWHNTVYGWNDRLGFKKPVVSSQSGASIRNGSDGDGNCYYRNNICCDFSVAADAQKVSNNIVITDSDDAQRYFADEASDWRLKAASPAIDAAHTTDYALTDYAGTARPQGLFADCGAHEYKP